MLLFLLLLLLSLLLSSGCCCDCCGCVGRAVALPGAKSDGHQAAVKVAHGAVAIDAATAPSVAAAAADGAALVVGHADALDHAFAEGLHVSSAGIVCMDSRQQIHTATQCQAV